MIPTWSNGVATGMLLSWLCTSEALLLPSQTWSLSKPLPSSESRLFTEWEEDVEYQEELSRVLEDPPLETVLDMDLPPVTPDKPKIVVLGATGRTGRLVVQQLLDMKSIDMTVVGFVRDFHKANRLLYDEFSIPRKAKKHGPTLEIVEGDLVPPEEMPGCAVENEDERLWRQRAESASKFYGTNVQQFDNRQDLPDINEALMDALKDCTAVISCLGTVRPTNLWTDVLARPFWRLLRSDVSQWCKDRRHPYYVHYTTTRKVLGYLEREQLRREAAVPDEEEDKKTPIPRIRFIRISDLCVTQEPWYLVPFIANALQSVVMRYHEMAEQLLERSTLIETVLLRPGDLVDDERDVNTTSLQVNPTGKVDWPARVGREDVAALAVASAMFPTKSDKADDRKDTCNHTTSPFHYTFACRWVGQELSPYPAQGCKSDGETDADTAIQRVLQRMYKKQDRIGKLLDSVVSEKGRSKVSLVRDKQERRLKRYGVWVAVPIYTCLGVLFMRLAFSCLRLFNVMNLF